MWGRGTQPLTTTNPSGPARFPPSALRVCRALNLPSCLILSPPPPPRSRVFTAEECIELSGTFLSGAAPLPSCCRRFENPIYQRSTPQHRSSWRGGNNFACSARLRVLVVPFVENRMKLTVKTVKGQDFKVDVEETAEVRTAIWGVTSTRGPVFCIRRRSMLFLSFRSST